MAPASPEAADKQSLNVATHATDPLASSVDVVVLWRSMMGEPMDVGIARENVLKMVVERRTRVGVENCMLILVIGWDFVESDGYDY